MGFTHKKSDDNEGDEVSDDNDTIIHEDYWNLLRVEATFDDYLNLGKDDCQ